MEDPVKPALKSMETLSFLNNFESRTMYRQADSRRQTRLLDGNNGTPEDQLSRLATEIKLRVKITQQEIYFIGEMLVQAREMLTQEKDKKQSFKDWVEKNFEFGYHTALNFCNVYTACMGYLPFIVHAKPSILYKISAKDFPKDLREVLMINDLLKELTNTGLEEVYIKFNAEGLKAVEPLLKEKSGQYLIYSQSVPFFDQLSKLKYQIEKLVYDTDRRIDYQYSTGIDGLKGATEAGDAINKLIFNSFKKCAAILDETYKEANECLRFIKDDIILAKNTTDGSDKPLNNSGDEIIEITSESTIGYKKVKGYLDEKMSKNS